MLIFYRICLAFFLFILHFTRSFDVVSSEVLSYFPFYVQVHHDIVDQYIHMSHVMVKPAFGICENKGTDQLHDNRSADQRLFLLHRIR